jgi:hypothetical protein
MIKTTAHSRGHGPDISGSPAQVKNPLFFTNYAGIFSRNAK